MTQTLTDAERLSDWNARLRAHAGRLVDALDQLRPPATVADITQQARAVSTVKRMIDLVFNVARPKAAAQPAEAKAGTSLELPDDKMARMETLAAALEAELPPMNRQQRRNAERLAKKNGQAARSSLPPLSSP